MVNIDENVFGNLGQVAALLTATPALLRSLLLPLEEPALCRRPGPDDWCIKEVIGHLIETDQSAFLGRIRRMIDEDQPELSGLDIHGLVHSRRDAERPIDELLDTLAAQRAEAATVVASLTPAQLARTAPYPKHNKVFSVADFVYEWPFHDAAHTKQIFDLLQDQMVPFMTDAMRSAVGR